MKSILVRELSLANGSFYRQPRLNSHTWIIELLASWWIVHLLEEEGEEKEDHAN